MDNAADRRNHCTRTVDQKQNMCVAPDTMILILGTLFVFGLGMAVRHQWKDQLSENLSKRIRMWGIFAMSAIMMLTAVALTVQGQGC